MTHFRNQRECDAAIRDVCSLLHVDRAEVGLFASPKGWFGGEIVITEYNEHGVQETVRNGRNPSGSQGMPITREWILRSLHSKDPRDAHTTRNYTLQSNAKCILIIEKEGIYLRLMEDQLHHSYPCILLTGKGYPDAATHSLLYLFHIHFPNLPIYGVCDCNPYGLHVLQMYARGRERDGLGEGSDGGGVEVQWIGLRPGYVKRLK